VPTSTRRPDLVAKYQLEGPPWIGVIDGDGNPLRVHAYAFETPEEMTAWVKGS
jgi:hypothetical protein